MRVPYYIGEKRDPNLDNYPISAMDRGVNNSRNATIIRTFWSRALQ